MKRNSRRNSGLAQAGLALLVLCIIAGWFVSARAQVPGPQPNLKADAITGVVTSAKGPEAGVWVIAETRDLPTRMIKIVVTDDRGRYLLPELPKANYRVWVRGYGLVDSAPVQARPGQRIDLKAIVAPTPQAAAKIFPASYWFSLLQVPDKSEFPMKPTPMPEWQERTNRTSGGGAQVKPVAQQTEAPKTGRRPSGGVNEEVGRADPRGMATQEQWIDNMKQGCELCHQIGDFATRDIRHMQSRYHFKSSEEAWATRIHFGQGGASMVATLSRYVDQQRAIKMYADWSDRIAAGEVPPTPPRPQGVERNIVISMWDWGGPGGHPHDEIATDRRNPTINANGLVYAVDYNSGELLTLDPSTAEAGAHKVPTLGDASKMRTTWPQQLMLPSPYYGERLELGSDVTGPHNPMMDEKGRVWITSNIRPRETPDFCRENSDNPFAKVFPIDSSFKQVTMWDPEAKKFSLIDTCFNTHHLQFATNSDVLYFSGGGPVMGWLDTKALDSGKSAEEAQGWCAPYLDSNGDGKIDPAQDKRIAVNGYGVIVNPIDQSVWYATTRPTPGHILRVTRVPGKTGLCMAEVYEPPFNNPKMPQVKGYAPRGIDVDRNGVIWTALSGSSQLASFDRRKCKVTHGDGQQCPEGWTLYTVPGPKMKGLDTPADFHYYNWVDQFNTLGLGDNVPVVNGTDSDSLIAFLPKSKQWVRLQVPYPLGFYTRGLDGRIDDARAGWKGRGWWAVYAPDLLWHMEEGPGSLSKAVKFQLRPNPLAD